MEWVKLAFFVARVCGSPSLRSEFNLQVVFERDKLKLNSDAYRFARQFLEMRRRNSEPRPIKRVVFEPGTKALDSAGQSERRPVRGKDKTWTRVPLFQFDG